MFGSMKGRIIIIALVLAGSIGFFLNNGLKRGLDLQGGMHLALEVDDPTGTMTAAARADATDRALKIIRTRINQFGVEEPLIQKSGSDRIIVELPGVSDEQRAKDVIQQTAFLEFQLVLPSREVIEALPRIDRAIVQALGPEGLSETKGEQPRQAIEDLLFKRDTDAVEVETGGNAEPQATEQRPLTALLLDSGVDGEFLVEQADVETVQRYLALPEVQRLLPRGTTLRFSSPADGVGAQLYKRLYVLQDKAFMTGESLVNATAGRDPQFNLTIVQFELNRRGGRIFDNFTGANIGNRIAIVLDKEVYSAPVVNSRIGARGQIELGQSSLQEANDLALVLRAGSLPAPLKVIEERTIGPSLGADSIQQGMIAGIIGVILILAIMISYYKLSGFLAILALGYYVVLMIGGLAAINATLTAPGIGGLILSIGMAVDANVLIFERIREELAAGRSIRMAVDEGFSNAMSAIVDSNLTTLITALILFQFGTGPVRGFAVTLSIGIIASFFSAVFVTRTLFQLYLQRKRAPEALSI
jgi:preprotein translocase subunit SecD